MVRVGKFEKVSLEQFKKDWINTFGDRFPDNQIKHIYDEIKLPTRATTGSAGYDFKSPIYIKLNQQESIKIPTGIKVRIENGWVLKCYPRSGLGFKYRVQLVNTVGIIDSDYFFSNNEGHIFSKLINDNYENQTVEIHMGDGFMQGIFEQFGITYDDNVTEIRNGGFGSTNK